MNYIYYLTCFYRTFIIDTFCLSMYLNIVKQNNTTISTKNHLIHIPTFLYHVFIANTKILLAIMIMSLSKSNHCIKNFPVLIDISE